VKKKLLFVHHQMNIGGVESALLSTLRLLSPEKYDITLMLMWLGGPLFDEIPPYVKVVEIPFSAIGEYRRRHGWNATLKYSIKAMRWFHAFKMIALKIRWVILYRWRDIGFNDVEAYQINSEVDKSRLPRGFDFAFAYFGGVLNGDFVSRYYSDSITGIWFHNEGSRFKLSKWRELTRRFDYVFACSKSLADFFNRILSHNGDIHFETMPHYVDLEEYRRRAAFGRGLPPSDNGRPRILTVARIDHQKGIDIAIDTARLLKAGGQSFKWYVVGDGALRGESEALVKAYGLVNDFIFLGSRKNPFACYRDCDIYVQPSRVEAYGLTIAEARAFYKPIVTTDTVGGGEQIKDGETGLVVPVGDTKALAAAVGRLLSDEALRKRLSATLAFVSVNQIEQTKIAWEMLLSEKM
jgi:glycosyltransferase involved in cell wall biosynthesis